MEEHAETRLAIVGAGPVGLALAIQLGLRGVRNGWGGRDLLDSYEAESRPIAAASAAGLPLEVVDIDHAEAAAIHGRRPVLVRPDGHVAWRGAALPEEATAPIDRGRAAA